MSKRKLWFGNLEAGSKSSPIVIDYEMETGEKNAIFIYNHSRKEILKYSRDVVEPKLRELTAKEKDLEAELKKAFGEAMKNFKFKTPKAMDAPGKTAAKSKPAKPAEEPDVDSSDMGGEDWDDSDD